MFTDKAQSLLDLAKDYAFSMGNEQLDLPHVLIAFGKLAEPGVVLADCLEVDPAKLRAACPQADAPASCPSPLPLTERLRAVLARAKQFAGETPDSFRPGFVNLRHLAAAVAIDPDACKLLGFDRRTHEEASASLSAWIERDAHSPVLQELTQRLREMREDLLTRVFGQDHAVHSFVEGLFNMELVATADTKRRSPRGVFVFAGPPGVGKTYLAEIGAVYLGRPFRRFDMSAYSGHQQGESLVGMGRGYQGAHPGILTDYVEKNPGAVLLFDEIEKAHIKTVHLFLQILDAGVLEDKFNETNVSFRDTIIIFTTNAGRRLYDRPNESGVHAANAAFHRKTILDSLASEKDPQTREPFFPPAICSRLATGCPILFNHLGVTELERVADAELNRVAALFERQYYKTLEFAPEIPLCLVLREGARTDARTLKSQVESFVKTEVFKFCQLFRSDRLEQTFSKVDLLRIALDQAPDAVGESIGGVFEPQHTPRILLIAGAETADVYRSTIAEVDWLFAGSADTAIEILAREEVELTLVDLWLGIGLSGDALAMARSQGGFDHIPMATRELDRGQEVLRLIHERAPHVPVFLLSLSRSEDQGQPGTVDSELFLACVRGGGARGLIVSRFVEPGGADWQQRRDRFAESLVATCKKLHREKAAERLGQERKVLSFDTVPEIDETERRVTVRLRNLRFTRAVSADDSGEVLDDVERPRTKFDDVLGARAAKEELRFFIDFLRNPRRFMALGLEPPKGVLLHGPPGTGKTMLARAMAGESDVAFITVSATSFVTIWQGSGPQSVRDLFARARRYAPAIIFIDEIDAIARERTGTSGAGQAEEVTLNALLTEMDGFTSPAPDRPVFVLAATNFEVEDQDRGKRNTRKLDRALVRRFSRCIKVDLPERSARLAYLQKRLANRAECSVTDPTIQLLAQHSSGMSISDLARVVEAASRMAVKKECGLDDSILHDAFETVRFGETRARRPEENERTARHESGHALLYWLSGWWASSVTIVSRGRHGGYMAHAAEETERGGATRPELLSQIRTTLGGRAAELLYYGEEEGLSTGAESDLESATDLARQMVSRFGMDKDFGLLAPTELWQYESALSSPVYLKINAAANRILAEQMQEARRLLAANRRHLDALATELVQKERLADADLRRILPAATENGAVRPPSSVSG